MPSVKVERAGNHEWRQPNDHSIADHTGRSGRQGTQGGEVLYLSMRLVEEANETWEPSHSGARRPQAWDILLLKQRNRRAELIHPFDRYRHL
ncbi:hypothetical protein PHISCL_05801 [Aspergillus sclerotialis]|uniref:Uncharacterized protein n=1 Tax=Aspergillus sclerotialis TaxID=2070753 RepID=A0A3A2ZGX0_9EURO|nr:hypothetical protein PHISCL_05801 [Aspergillus sclerotialis]